MTLTIQNGAIKQVEIVNDENISEILYYNETKELDNNITIFDIYIKDMKNNSIINKKSFLIYPQEKSQKLLAQVEKNEEKYNFIS